MRQRDVVATICVASNPFLLVANSVRLLTDRCDVCHISGKWYDLIFGEFLARGEYAITNSVGRSGSDWLVRGIKQGGWSPPPLRDHFRADDHVRSISPCHRVGTPAAHDGGTHHGRAAGVVFNVALE